MNVTLTNRSLLQANRRFSSPPKPPMADNAFAPRDSIQLSGAQSKPSRLSQLRSSTSALAIAVSMMGVMSTGSAAAAAAGEELSLEVQAIHNVQDSNQLQLTKLSNERFSEYPTLRELTEDGSLAKGEEGEHIEAVQQALLDMGFAIEAGPTGGLYNQTLNALNNFRASVDMEPSQDLDLATLKKLDELAPPPGMTLAEHPTASFPEAQFVNGQAVRVQVNISEHRLFFYNAQGEPQAVYPVAVGKPSKPTDPGLKIVNFKYDDPSPVARQLWPESGGKAFGTKLIDLKWYDAETGDIVSSDEELHGTFNRQSIGTDASSGCVRLYNEDVEAIYPLLKKGDFVQFND